MLAGGYLQYALLGAKHMLTGYDHLLFLFGVIFFLTRFADVAKFVTAFTLGHCITLIFATNLHHSFIGAIARSYVLFPPDRAVPVGDAAELAIRTVGESFALGVQLAAPVIVFSLVLNLAAGLIGRMLPQFQIFFVATPINVLVGLSVFALSLGLIGLVWIDRYEAYLQRFTGAGGG